LLIFFVWYGLVRFVLETLREGNWTFNGVPVAQIVSLLFVIPALVILAWRHRPGHPTDDPPSHPEAATWGAIGRPVEPTLDGEDDDDEPDDVLEASEEAEPEVAADLEADETSEPDAEPDTESPGEPESEPEADEPEAEPAAQPEAEPAAEPEADPATDQ
jgi:hypothetical protein